MAAVQDTALWREVDAVFDSPAKPFAFTLEVLVHANGKDISPLYVIDESVYGNYIKNHTDDSYVTLVFPLGQYDYDIQPYAKNLELTIRRIPFLEKLTPMKDNNQPIMSYRYRGILFENKSDSKEGNNPAVFNKEIADRADIKTIRVQLTDPIYEQLRTNTIGTNFRDCTGADVITAVLGSQSETPRKDAATAPVGVTVAPRASKTVRDHISIPDNTPVLKVPDVVDRVCGGVFSTGLAFYLKNTSWFVFSPYDVMAFDTAPKTLTLINIPSNRIVSPERSYRETQNQVIVLITGKVVHVDKSHERLLNLGNGVRFVDASRVMEGFGETGDNKYAIAAADNVNEIVASRNPSGVDYVPESSQRFTTNYHHEFAKLAVRAGSTISMVWENSNDAVLYPGMPVKYMYIKDQVAQAVQGILIGCETYTSTTSKSVGTRRFTSTSALTIFIGDDL